MADEQNASGNQAQNQTNDGNQNESSSSGETKNSGKTKNNTPTDTGDPGRTPGSAEGDEETIDADIREKEANGKL